MAQLQQFEGDHNLFNPANQFAGDDRLPIEFYMGILQNDAKTLEVGHPVFDDVEFIRIYNSKDNIIDRPVRDTDKRRWPARYQAWKMGQLDEGAGSSGMKLEYWPALTRAQSEEFKYLKIFTVEQLAEVPDSIGSKIMGFQKYKALARAYVETAAGQAPLLKLQAELDEEKSKNAALTDQISKLAARMEKLEKKKE